VVQSCVDFFPGESVGAAAPPAGTHQRVDGAARLELKRAGDGRTALSDLYQRAPCRVLFPAPETGDPLLAVLLTTSGGLTGGDCTDVAAIVGPQACATVTTQAAEKIYRALATDRETRVRVEVSVAAGAWAEWLAQETILFDGARLRRTLRADVAASGRLLALESMVFGRTEMGERFESGRLHDAWYVTRDGRPVWIDALRLEGDVGRLRAAPFGLGTCVAYSTLLYVGADAAEHLDFARDSLACSGGLGAATVFDGVLIVRAMADRAHDLRVAMAVLAAGLRHEAGGWPARLPRVWSC
jgi:urease accessory protein